MDRKSYKRRQYIVDPDFQYSIIRKTGILIGLMVVMSLCFLTLIYYLYGDVRLALVQPDPFSASVVDGLAGQRSLIHLLWPVMVVCIAITVIITFVLGILFSHRMAGPIFRMKSVLSEMADGELRGQDQLRKKDDFKSLMDAINRVKKGWNISIGELFHLCSQLEQTVTTENRIIVKNMKTILNRFKIDMD
jgi:hypothetical protein